MKRIFVIGATLLLCAALMSDSSWARGGGRGGGGHAGGGGGRSAPKIGGGGGGPSRSAPKANFGGAAKTPSMSRANLPSAKPQARPAVGGNKPSVAGNRPNVGNKPSVGGNRPNLDNKPSVGSNRPNLDNKPTVGSNRPNVGNKPNIGDNRPNVGNKPGTAANRPGVNNKPGLPGIAGGTVAAGRNPSKDDLNSFLNLPGESTRNTTIDRNKIGGGNNQIGDNKTRIGGGDNKLGNKVEVGDININAGNKVAINRENNYNNIRNKYNNIDNRPFNRDQWRDHVNYDHDHWHYHDYWDRYDDNWFWKAAGWATVGAFTANIINNANPIRYDYGSTVVYRDNVVYVNDQQAGTPAEYYTQAEQIVESTPENVNEEQIEWMPLGVYAIAEENSASDSGMLLQLAVSKEGIIAGTFYNETTDISRPVEGMVDGKSQRAAWQFADGKNEEIVMEAGIYNLTEENSTALVHFGPDQTQTWLMVRLSDPSE